MAEETDYDRQYKEDLERAQALSLESLALEQFKNKRLQELNNVPKNKNVSVSRASSMTETDSHHINKSRPRPGTSSGSLNSSLIAPPPPSQRKMSATSFDSPDLISFSNPPTHADNIIEFCNQQSYSNNSMTTFPNPPQLLQQFAYRPYNIQNNVFTPVQQWYSPPQQPPRPPIAKPIQQIPFSEAPALPPKNQKQTPPPLTVSSSKSRRKPPGGHNLIDLAPDDTSSVRVSILQEFDPILSSPLRASSPVSAPDDAMSVCGSVYDEYDPYDIYTGSGNNSLADPVYAAVVISETASPPPPVPPRIQNIAALKRNNDRNMKDKLNLLDCILKVPNNGDVKDVDLKAFFQMVYRVRNRFKYNDPNTNMGLVISPMVNCEYREGTSIKLSVYPDYEGADTTKPFNFTCDVNTSVEHVTDQIKYDLDAPSQDNYTLKVWGCNEYLVPTTFLSDYEYVHNCIKLDQDIVLNLIPDSKVDKSFARTLVDDNRDKHLSIESVIPNEVISHISYDNLLILLETVEQEMKKLENDAVAKDHCNNSNMMPVLQPQRVIQSVKCVVNLIGKLCTLDIMKPIDDLQKLCNNFNTNCLTFADDVSSICNRIRSAIENLLDMYCQTYDVDFIVKKSLQNPEPSRTVSDVHDELLVRVCAIYRPPNDWKHESYIIVAQIYHGSKPIGHPVVSLPCRKSEQDQLWPSRIVIDHWFDMTNVLISSLAREARLVFVIYGRTVETQDNGGSDKNGEVRYKQEIIGWASYQFFNYDGELAQGNMILSIWSPETPFAQGPSPASGTHPLPDHPMLDIQIPYTCKVEFPPVSQVLINNVQKADFNSLDNQTQRQLLDICDQDMLYKLAPEIREVFWEKRHYLYHIPEALPKVLLAAHSWEYACLPDLHGMLKVWHPLKPIQALELLLPTFPDLEVRKKAVTWIRNFRSDELIDFIPQLVVALKHETYETSPLAEFLLDAALRSPRFAHHLFWLLSHTLPTSIPQNASIDPVDIDINEVRHHRRMKLMLRALLAICGEALQKCFLSQQVLVKDLNEIAEKVKETKENHRETVLHNALGSVHYNLSETPTSLPLSPTLRVAGVLVRSCSYFPSNTLPLKITFLAPDKSLIPAIYKVGDDLQQDMLTLQVVRLMDKLWLNNGLDLKMVSFACVPTGKRKGMIEMVTNAETLRKIQMEHGLTGSFKDKPIAEWLAKHNPSELEYTRAVENFTASCAGYCVVTYILGICDRHNDNIMLKTSGHLFHIDFGKFLGDAQMFGNFKRDRTPFVLTSDMAYVINGGDRPSEKFQKFVDLCCQAFNIVRNNSNLFLCLFTMMFQGRNSGSVAESVSYLHNALLPGKSNPEAVAYFARLIESSMKSWFTQVNFFLHNLAQMKFSTDHNNEDALLSFVPKTYTMESDGKLVHVKVNGFLKRYDPDKYYVYMLEVHRANNISPMFIQRTYKEFCELHQKLCMCFPLAKLHSLSTGLHVGRSNIKQVAEKRFPDICQFIKSLFACAEEIAHSNLVYTFFHPLLRDQQDQEDFSRKLKDRKVIEKKDIGRLKGQLKLSFQYTKNVFCVMIYHLRSLPFLASGQEPSTYVKVYLLPDPGKTTKRKTKVVKRNCHPSFVEMLEYRMGFDIIKERRLRATVWNYDSLQENEFLGGVELDLGQFDLTKETVEWYPLVNLPR